jgi:peptidoglycan/xylan/chitin deacetylase (PgdA/CDA1 family)
VRPVVLCYHAVSDGWPHLLSVRREDFERQLSFLLSRGYRPATAREAITGHGKLFHVTFDDAFTSVRNAVPVLERLSVPATIFVCSGLAARGEPLHIRELAGEADAHGEELRTLDWKELRELAGAGRIEIGAHTVSHAHLRALPDDELERELVESKARIEDELGRPCPLFAYPYGEHDDRVRRAARAAGFDVAFGLQPESASWNDAYRLPRVGVWRDEGMRAFSFKVSPVGRSLPVVLLRRARKRLS